MGNLETLLHSVETIFTFFLIGVLGYYLAKIGWFTAESSAMFSQLLTKIVIPVNLFYNIQIAMTRREFIANSGSMLIPILSIVIAIGVGWLVARAARLPRSHRSIFITAFACSNTINIGLPINTALFGDTALPAILIYYMANTIVFWTFGNYLLASDSKTREPAPVLSMTTAKRVFSPAFLAFVVGALFLLAGIPLPATLGNAMKYVGNMVTPVSTMCIGIAIFETGFKNIKVDREILLLCLGRFVISPLILVGLLYLMPVPELTYKVFLIQASLPPMSSIALLAIFYQTDTKFASVAVSFTTLCALVTVPIYMQILSWMF